jgi:hypothetical protein
LVEVHVNSDVPPGATMVGAAVNAAVGRGAGGVTGGGAGATTGALTATFAVAAGLLPPGPLQTSEYVVAAVSDAVLCVPLDARLPLQPPLALHAVAFVEFQVRVALAPGATVAGVAVSVAVGTGGTVTVAVGAGLGVSLAVTAAVAVGEVPAPEPPQAANDAHTTLATRQWRILMTHPQFF